MDGDKLAVQQLSAALDGESHCGVEGALMEEVGVVLGRKPVLEVVVLLGTAAEEQQTWANLEVE
jgi:hypothetical protein